MSTSGKHPVDALKELIEMTPEEEARFRAICDEPVLVCPVCVAGVVDSVAGESGVIACVTCGKRWEAGVTH